MGHSAHFGSQVNTETLLASRGKETRRFRVKKTAQPAIGFFVFLLSILGLTVY